MSELTDRDSEFRRLVEQVIEEEEGSTPEQQATFRREFLLTLAKGFLLYIGPDPDTGEMDTERADIRIKTRTELDEFRAAYPEATALEILRAGHEFSVKNYLAVAQTNYRFGPECILAQGIQHSLVVEPEVDEAFAQEALDYIEQT